VFDILRELMHRKFTGILIVKIVFVDGGLRECEKTLTERFKPGS